jgi:hypothetical protein
MIAYGGQICMEEFRKDSEKEFRKGNPIYSSHIHDNNSTKGRERLCFDSIGRLELSKCG